MLARPQRTRLNRALSKLGLCSRGTAAEWIAQGRVRVNGLPAHSPEQWVELGTDRIEADPPPRARGGSGAPEFPSASRPGAKPPERNRSGTLPKPVYLAMHKPKGYVTTRSDELGRATVYDLLPEPWAGEWVFPVGRLDRDSEGLLLLTNDGAWSDGLADPARHVPKVYRVKLDGRPLPDELRRFAAGIDLDGIPTAPAEAVPESGNWVRVTLREGRNRQIRRMFHALGRKVKRLIRVSIGPLELGDLEPGRVRELAAGEARALAQAAGRR